MAARSPVIPRSAAAQIAQGEAEADAAELRQGRSRAAGTWCAGAAQGSVAGGIMSDDPPPPLHPVWWDMPASLEIRARLAPTQDELDALTDKELVARINGLINGVDAGHVSIEGAADKMVILACVQYLRDELARRRQDRQTRWIIRMTAVITLMTAVIMVATAWPETFRYLQSAVHSLLIRASQVIDLWPWRG